MNKFLGAVLLVSLLGAGNSFADSRCYPPETARNAVKMLLAFGHAPAVKQVCGSAEGDEGSTVVNVVPQYYDSTEDVYQVRVRNSDCKVLELMLAVEKQAASVCK